MRLFDAYLVNKELELASGWAMAAVGELIANNRALIFTMLDFP